jgi:MerR family transcriptional regulator, light-induced transcriptional regulator
METDTAPSPAGLTIREVSLRSGITISTLRAWEARYGFPAPLRLPSGHRRYTEHVVPAIRRVAQERRNGLSLAAAIARAEAAALPGEHSIFAGLRRAARELPVQVMGVQSMLAISRAIEDECYAHGDRHVIFGAFQTERFFRRAAHRWRELARTGDHSVVFADFPHSGLSATPAQVPLAGGSAVRREWAVVCDSPAFTACLAGWERPRDRAGAPRRFEAIWTVEPRLVREASRVCVELVNRAAPELGAEIAARLDSHPARGMDDLRSATILTNRVVGYLDELAGRP